jgi:hypothetical protein
MKALEKLPEDDKRQFLPLAESDHRDYLDTLLDLTTASRDLFQEKKWKFTFAGKDIVVRDKADKILAWVDKFKVIVDTAVQYDPGHAALPWAAVRFLLQVGFAGTMQGLKISDNFIDCCRLQRKQRGNPYRHRTNYEASSAMRRLRRAVPQTEPETVQLFRTGGLSYGALFLCVGVLGPRKDVLGSSFNGYAAHDIIGSIKYILNNLSYSSSTVRSA